MRIIVLQRYAYFGYYLISSVYILPIAPVCYTNRQQIVLWVFCGFFFFFGGGGFGGGGGGVLIYF